MTWRTVIRQTVPAGSSRRLRAVIRDEGGALLPASALTALYVTVTDRASGAVVNGRDHQNVLGVNGGEVSEAGRLTLWLDPADTSIQDSAKSREVRIVVIEWEYGTARMGRHEVDFGIVRTT